MSFCRPDPQKNLLKGLFALALAVSIVGVSAGEKIRRSPASDRPGEQEFQVTTEQVESLLERLDANQYYSADELYDRVQSTVKTHSEIVDEDFIDFAKTLETYFATRLAARDETTRQKMSSNMEVSFHSSLHLVRITESLFGSWMAEGEKYGKYQDYALDPEHRARLRAMTPRQRTRRYHAKLALIERKIHSDDLEKEAPGAVFDLAKTLQDAWEMRYRNRYDFFKKDRLEQSLIRQSGYGAAIGTLAGYMAIQSFRKGKVARGGRLMHLFRSLLFPSGVSSGITPMAKWYAIGTRGLVGANLGALHALSLENRLREVEKASQALDLPSHLPPPPALSLQIGYQYDDGESAGDVLYEMGKDLLVQEAAFVGPFLIKKWMSSIGAPAKAVQGVSMASQSATQALPFQLKKIQVGLQASSGLSLPSVPPASSPSLLFVKEGGSVSGRFFQRLPKGVRLTTKVVRWGGKAVSVLGWALMATDMYNDYQDRKEEEKEHHEFEKIAQKVLKTRDAIRSGASSRLEAYQAVEELVDKAIELSEYQDKELFAQEALKAYDTSQVMEESYKSQTRRYMQLQILDELIKTRNLWRESDEYKEDYELSYEDIDRLTATTGMLSQDARRSFEKTREKVQEKHLISIRFKNEDPEAVAQIRERELGVLSWEFEAWGEALESVRESLLSRVSAGEPAGEEIKALAVSIFEEIENESNRVSEEVKEVESRNPQEMVQAARKAKDSIPQSVLKWFQLKEQTLNTEAYPFSYLSLEHFQSGLLPSPRSTVNNKRQSRSQWLDAVQAKDWGYPVYQELYRHCGSPEKQLTAYCAYLFLLEADLQNYRKQKQEIRKIETTVVGYQEKGFAAGRSALSTLFTAALIIDSMDDPFTAYHFNSLISEIKRRMAFYEQILDRYKEHFDYDTAMEKSLLNKSHPTTQDQEVKSSLFDTALEALNTKLNKRAQIYSDEPLSLSIYVGAEAKQEIIDQVYAQNRVQGARSFHTAAIQKMESIVFPKSISTWIQSWFSDVYAGPDGSGSLWIDHGQEGFAVEVFGIRIEDVLGECGLSAEDLDQMTRAGTLKASLELGKEVKLSTEEVQYVQLKTLEKIFPNVKEQGKSCLSREVFFEEYLEQFSKVLQAHLP